MGSLSLWAVSNPTAKHLSQTNLDTSPFCSGSPGRRAWCGDQHAEDLLGNYLFWVRHCAREGQKTRLGTAEISKLSEHFLQLTGRTKSGGSLKSVLNLRKKLGLYYLHGPALGSMLPQKGKVTLSRMTLSNWRVHCNEDSTLKALCWRYFRHVWNWNLGSLS